MVIVQNLYWSLLLKQVLHIKQYFKRYVPVYAPQREGKGENIVVAFFGRPSVTFSYPGHKS
jgi:hypothetical protein